MDSASCQPTAGLLPSEAPDVDNAASQDGSDDGGRGSPMADATSATGVDSKPDTGSRIDSSLSKDLGKKKKSRGSAKLKQSKLDIRREQFLAQVAAKTLKGSSSSRLQQKQETPVAGPGSSAGVEDQGNGPMSCDSTDCGSSQLSSTGTDEDYEVDEAVAVAKKQDICSDPKQDTTQEGANDSTKKKGKTASAPALLPCKSLGGSQQPALKVGKKSVKGGPKVNGRNGVSLHQNETPGNTQTGEQGDLEDDWEAAAEEFSKQVAKIANGRAGKMQEVSSGEAVKTDSEASSEPQSSEPSAGIQSRPSVPGAEYSFRPNQQDPNMHPRLCAPASLRPEYSFSGSAFTRSRSATDRAWRPDDVSRPPTLPPAWTHRANGRGLLGIPGDAASWRMPQLSQSHWPAPSAVPANQAPCCPICAEELDTTDSSFVPCSCGFRLCLFCHHRIAADDGRCPGCRRAYSPDAANRPSKPANLWLRL